MHTAHSLTIFPSMLCSALEGVPGPGGGAWSRGSAPGGGCLVWRGGIPACTETDPPLWTEFLTHASENIILPKTSFAGGNDTK